MIPKIIHYCWLSGEPFPDLIKKCIDSWKKYLPDYQIIEWNNQNFNVNICEYTKQAYDAGKYAFVSDYVRLYAVYHYGGIYLDTDIEVIKNFDELLKNKAFTGFENSSNIAAWIFGSEKMNPLFKEFLKYYDSRKFIKSNGEYDLTPNPVPLTAICVQHGLRLENEVQHLNLITVYTIDFFCPKDYRTGKINCTKNTYCIHHFRGAWQPTLLKFKMQAKRKIIRTLGFDLLGLIYNIKRYFNVKS